MKEEIKTVETETINHMASRSTNPRASRSTESRAFESRVAEERPPIVFGGGTRFNVPPSVMKDDPDHVYGFVVYSSGNTEQKENYYEAMDRGWKPVPAAEHPSLSRGYEMTPFERREEGDQLIRRGGQILMKRTTETHTAEQDYFDSEKQRQQYMADMYKQNDPRYPKPFMDERKRSRVKS